MVAGGARDATYLEPLFFFCSTFQYLKIHVCFRILMETRAPTEKTVQPIPSPVFTKKENATLAQRIEILDWHNANGKNQSKTTWHFAPLYPNLQIKQPLISSWVKDEVKWRDQWNNVHQQGDKSSKRARQTEHPEVSEMMALWVTKALADKILLTGEVLRQKWETFAGMAGVPEEDRLKLSNGWLSRFKERFGLKQFKRHGEAGSVEETTIEDERKRIREVIKEFMALGHTLRDVFNMDETGLFYGYVPFLIESLTKNLDLSKHRMAPDRGLTNSKQSGVKGNKIRITYALTLNADGSEKLPPFVIGKAACPRAFQQKTGEQLGFYYRNNAKAWMTGHLYQEWIRKWDVELQQQNRKILLLQDNFSAHIIPDDLQNIRVENFEPNLTAHVQPNDQGVIRCFKAHYCARFIERSINQYDEGITPGNIYDINQLQAMRLADLAWHDVNLTTIRNCWRKSGILPDMDDSSSQSSQPTSLLNYDPVLLAEAAVDHSLNGLVATGALQKKNRMVIESLLNPVGESHNLTETSDREICNAVMEAIDARETMEINGGDDVDEDFPAEPQPSRQDILKATSTLTRFVEKMDDPIARKLEGLLCSLNMQLRLEETRNLKNTHITSYFNRS